MKLEFILKLAAAALPAVIPATADEKPTCTVVMLGDSTTLCARNRPGGRLTDYIQDFLARERGLRAVIVNSGKGSDTAKGGYARLQAAVLDHDPDIVTISFGLNDTILLTPEEYRDWLEKIILAVQENSRARILLVTSTPFDNARHSCGKQFGPKGGLDEYLDEKICGQTRGLAKKYILPICDLHAYFKGKFGETPALMSQALMPDGVHLTDEGNKIAAKHLAPMVAGLIEETGADAGK